MQTSRTRPAAMALLLATLTLAAAGCDRRPTDTAPPSMSGTNRNDTAIPSSTPSNTSPNALPATPASAASR